ncbi:MAG: hypothetical protein KDC42_00865 [Ignavibacteriae bacterium]|nr:hypothetical protein [Ignavibacteriota bacterium]
MKKILLLLLAVAVSFSFSCSSSNKSSSNKNVKVENKTSQDTTWSTIDYHYRTGTVSPEYYYHYRVLINYDKTAQFIFYPSYADTGFSQEQFTISDSQLKSLTDAIVNSNVLEGNIKEETDHPIGGPTESMTITIVNPDPNLDQSPVRIEVPAFPTMEYKEGLVKVYSVIYSLLPAGMLDEAKSKNGK